MLSSCLPVIFTAASGATFVAAKDQKVGQSVDDLAIATKIKASFIKNNFRELYSKISIAVVQGRVLFTGTVDKQADITQALAIAWEQPGVIEVLNELKVDPKNNYFDLLQYTKDTLITAQIKSKLLVYRDVKLVNYTVVTLNNHVYLFGIARSVEELKIVSEIAAKIRGVEKVISHAKVKEPSEQMDD